MLKFEILDNIKELITPILQEGQFRMIDVSIHFRRKRLLLKFFIDRISGGITLDECARLNEKIGDVLDREGIIEQSYILEVSSPGLDRSLLSSEDFSRCINRKVRIFLNEPQGQIYEVSGVIISVTDSGINLDSGEGVQQIPFGQIKKGKQVI